MSNDKAVKKLRHLHKWISENVSPGQFYFGDFVAKHDKNNCGTICCLAGWSPAAFAKPGEKPKWGNSPLEYWNHTGFDLATQEQFERIFLPGLARLTERSGLYSNVSLAEALKHLERCTNDLAKEIDIGSPEYGKWVEAYHERWKTPGRWQ